MFFFFVILCKLLQLMSNENVEIAYEQNTVHLKRL